MKKQPRSKKPPVRKAPAAKAVTQAPANGPRVASGVGPFTALMLCLPSRPAAARSSHLKASTRIDGTSQTAPWLTDDASTLLLLSMPVLAIIVSLGLTQSLKPMRRAELTATPASLNRPAEPAPTVQRPSSASALAAATAASGLPATTPPEIAANVAPLEHMPRSAATLPPIVQPPEALAGQAAAARTAMLDARLPATISTPAEPHRLPAGRVPELTSREAAPASPSVCEAPAHVLSRTRPAVHHDPTIASLTPAAFGEALAAAAQAQTNDFVIYNDKYRAIAYPGGDVQPLYGVCTDVIIRAYRALGIDLQPLVHEARLGSGDTSIDHRRTEVLRSFFARFGEMLPITAYAEDYLPGDIVTYNRPQNRHSRSHIAMVSSVPGPSGRYMIVHNRGWGPQLEDGLFVDEITGHYRYRSAPASASAVAAATPAAKVHATPQKRPAAVTRIAARDARVSALRRRDGAFVPGLGR